MKGGEITKKKFLILTLVLVLVMVGSVVAKANLENNEQPEDNTSLPSKKDIEELNNFENPAEKLIKRMKSEGKNKEEITKELNNQGFGWNPKTGATWRKCVGNCPSDEEIKQLNPLTPPHVPSPDQANQVMEVENEVYRGIR